ncbi:uncharacterized protein LOC125561992 [Nematostella vectensis]|uniref:uncharacterized protein LOC125561992 n=1 Tax=Nematostella vectensis TaxID=45351 RepID=UPI002076F125|nr:uncharacterized protein LOC125561992 [Nematostella vectensis]
MLELLQIDMSRILRFAAHAIGNSSLHYHTSRSPQSATNDRSTFITDLTKLRYLYFVLLVLQDAKVIFEVLYKYTAKDCVQAYPGIPGRGGTSLSVPLTRQRQATNRTKVTRTKVRQGHLKTAEQINNASSIRRAHHP